MFTFSKSKKWYVFLLLVLSIIGMTDNSMGATVGAQTPTSGQAICKATCEGDPKCKSWTYVRPDIQGPKARCWLKDNVPQAQQSNCCTSGIKSKVGFENNTDRPGSDYASFDLLSNGMQICDAACEGDPRCQSWTYVRAGLQGPNARCWLKDKVPQAQESDCCTSGIKSHQGFEVNTNRPGSDYASFDLLPGNSENSITDISLFPSSPATLTIDKRVNINFRYSTTEPGGVRIYVLPHPSRPIREFGVNGSPLYPTGSGWGSGFFSIGENEVTVNRITFRMVNAEQIEIFRTSIPVDYKFKTPINSCKGSEEAVYDFLANAHRATWTGTGTDRSLSYPLFFGEFGSPKGTVACRRNVILEDGRQYDSALDTHPTWERNGTIVGIYRLPSGLVQPWHKFTATVGFRSGAKAGDVTFWVRLADCWDNSEKKKPCIYIKTIEVQDKYDGKLKKLETETIVGKFGVDTVFLGVAAGENSGQDWAHWVDARIVRY